MPMLRYIITLVMAIGAVAGVFSADRAKYNFNGEWKLAVGDWTNAKDADFQDDNWKSVTLPHAFNEDEAFRVAIDALTDTICWYRKHFYLPKIKNNRYFAEFEGVRQGADFFLNGHRLGSHENGVMAAGFDLTPYLREGENVISVRVDNSWDYKERETGTPYQWNDKNFNANYGGIPKNVWLHVVGPVYQTLPLYSNLATTGVYVYASDFDIPAQKAVINTESEVRNDGKKSAEVKLKSTVRDMDGRIVCSFESDFQKIKPRETTVLKASGAGEGLNFWSWGYGYLYDVDTEVIDKKGRCLDKVVTKTGFRKTEFGRGLVKLNERVIQLHGYAQRTSNEWPGVGMSVPPWLSDFSNRLMVESGGNIVRWMHVTPWKQDIESCDRVGLIQSMPAGDSEKDREGRQWEMRGELMRDAIIYNRNNPSILFYESGNYRISPEHMEAMKSIRDKYDPQGGRAIGSREMLEVDNAEYGGEMLYINRSKKHPMWAHEYCRDEGLRKYWDDWSYPFHKHGDGPLYRGAKATEYNQNQDQLAVEMVRRWFDYWQERPGSGDRCSSGGAKIIFSDTNTHFRGEENYRRSGVVDPMRIPKDAFFAHQVMWHDTWVDRDEPSDAALVPSASASASSASASSTSDSALTTARTHIIGHWNYPEGTVKPVYVVSNSEDVELLVNGRSLGRGRRDYNFLFTFADVAYEPGRLVAISRDSRGNETRRDTLETASLPASLRLTAVGHPRGFHADGADMVLLEFEVVDSLGRRCPLDNRMVSFEIQGPAEWRGGIAQGPDNLILSKTLPAECGINRALLRSTTEAGDIFITARAEGMPDATLTLVSTPVSHANGASESSPVGCLEFNPADGLPSFLGFGPTPPTPSYKPRFRTIPIASVEAGSNQEAAANSFDDNEKSEWQSKGPIEDAWITFTFDKPSIASEIVLKPSGFRKKSYPLAIYAGDHFIWEGNTPKSLGYVHLILSELIETDRITVRLASEASEKDAFTIKELGQENAVATSPSPSKSKTLGIIEIEFLEKIVITEK